jgi:hypothetical protein
MAGACIVVYLFAPLYLLQFLALFLLFVILGARLYSEYLIRNLRVIRRDREIRCFRFEWTGVDLAVENRGRLPAFMAALGDWPGNLAVFKDHKRLCTLPGRSRLPLTWRAHCSERGISSLGPVQLRCADPLGLFPFTAAAGETTRLVVYPSPGFVDIPSPGGIPLGKLVSRNPLYEDLTRRRSLREYRRGDEPRRINWKASIRLGGAPVPGLSLPSLLVNEYEAAISYPLVVFLNLDPYEYPLGKRELWFERAIEAAAALCLMASRDRQDLGIILYTPWGEPAAAEDGAGQAAGDVHRPEGAAARQAAAEAGPNPGAGAPAGTVKAGPAAGSAGGDPCARVKPGPFTLLPILERLAAVKRPRGPRPPGAGDLAAPSGPPPDRNGAPGAANPRGSTRSLLDQGKGLPYGTRLIYAGPELPEEDYIALITLRAWHVSLEYLVLDERRLGPLGPGGAARYQMREGGYDIL